MIKIGLYSIFSKDSNKIANWQSKSENNVEKYRSHNAWHIFSLIKRRENIFVMRKIVIHSLRAEFRALIRGLLTNVEAFFVPSASREELFRICQTSKCDLLLTDDVRMFMNGSNAIEQIRQGSPLPQIFVLSQDLSEETVTTLLEEGVNQFIALPVAPERLKSKVSSQYKEFV